MKDKQIKGQAGIAQILSIAGAVLVAIIGGWFGQASRTDAKLETARAEQTANVLTISQRVTSSEVKVDNLQKDVGEIKNDVKSLLKLLK